ncbi:MAG: sigma-54-dependent Fis family transcriptional regulator [Planctomycetota bacterium]|nr:MAG: sigma-54-dependent Fis family transcriptional regulator [Planctomycetota bacterium]
MASILLIEDEENLRYSIATCLTRSGHDIAEASRVEDARTLVRARDFDLILTDVNLEGRSGVDLIAGLRTEGYTGAVVIMTAYGSIENAVRAMQLGAEDYLQKPVSLEAVQLVIDRALQRRRIQRRAELYDRLENPPVEHGAMLGQAPAWLDAVALAERFARVPLPDREPATTMSPILLLGETGTGKGLLARRIHDIAVLQGHDTASSAPPFVPVNCSALPPSLAESELFGHEKGAFTDARAARPGLFELADGGTIFLDEVGDTPLELQAKLLHVLEQGEFRRVGGQRARRVRVRVIAATNQDLDARIADGRFRRDLYYRLSAFTVALPPLRDRPGDAMLIARAVLARFAERLGRPAPALDDSARAAIESYDWPGNVRELINTVQRAAAVCAEGAVTADHLDLPAPPAAHAPPTPPATNGALRFDFSTGAHTLANVERELIRQALEHAGGNISRAARLAGMNRSSFRYRVERAGLDKPHREDPS